MYHPGHVTYDPRTGQPLYILAEDAHGTIWVRVGTVTCPGCGRGAAPPLPDSPAHANLLAGDYRCFACAYLSKEA